MIEKQPNVKNTYIHAIKTQLIFQNFKTTENTTKKPTLVITINLNNALLGNDANNCRAIDKDLDLLHLSVTTVLFIEFFLI